LIDGFGDEAQVVAEVGPSAVPLNRENFAGLISENVGGGRFRLDEIVGIIAVCVEFVESGFDATLGKSSAAASDAVTHGTRLRPPSAAAVFFKERVGFSDSVGRGRRQDSITRDIKAGPERLLE
jgi:hypothetical protein